MKDILISTKTLLPTIPKGIIQRERLACLVTDAAGRKRLTLVIAPAGYGKSTLLSQWSEKLDNQGIKCCWINLDREDNDPVRFLRYIIAALQQINSSLGENLLPQIHSGGTLSLDKLLATLVVDIQTLDTPVAIFFDDYHNITDSQANKILDWLIVYGPPQLTFFVGARQAPNLRINALKVSDQISLVSASDLSFNIEETGEFLNDCEGLGLSDHLIERLNQRTEGWGATIRLAMLALRGHNNAEQVISDFSGTDRDITDYLGEVVLSNLREPVRDFLLKTAMLERMNVELCNAVLQSDNAQDMLDEIEAANLFLIPLDRQRKWYRYHHMFSSFLEGLFRHKQPNDVDTVLRRASEWCQNNGYPIEAVRYAFKAQDYQQAAELISGLCENLVLYEGEHYTLLDWINKLPEEYIERWPRIRFAYAWSLIFTRRLKEGKAQLAILDRYCLRHSKNESATDEVNEIRCAEEMCRCIIYDFQDDTEASRQASASWLSKYPDAPPLYIASVNDALAYSALMSFEFSLGEQAIQESIRQSLMAGAQHALAWAHAIRGMIAIQRGDLYRAAKIYEEALNENSRKMGEYSYTGCLLSVHYSELLYEQNEIERASRLLEDQISFIENEGIVETCLAGYLTLFRISSFKGDENGARECLLRAEDAGHRFKLPRLVLASAAEQIELELSKGQLENAWRLARSHGFDSNSSVDSDQRDVTREIRSLVLCKLALAEERTRSCIGDLGTPIKRARKYGRVRHLLRLLTLRSIAYWQMGEREKGLRDLSQALELGERGGFFRFFIDCGPVVHEMIRNVADRLSANGTKQVATAGYAEKLLKAYPHAIPSPVSSRSVDEEIDHPLEPLSKREKQILALLNSGDSNSELAERLFISEQTVKWHLQKVYRKLGVKNRRGAIAQAQRFALL
jgi:ATP/maltotriose-dependent transcriptional regulator MalT